MKAYFGYEPNTLIKMTNNNNKTEDTYKSIDNKGIATIRIVDRIVNSKMFQAKLELSQLDFSKMFQAKLKLDLLDSYKFYVNGVFS